MRLESDLPRQYGKYELVQKLGDGGMAEVYLARLRSFGGFEKVVVIKQILPHLTRDPQVVDMFISEARISAEIQHKNIVQLFELEQLENGDLFMVLEYIQGTDLERLLISAAKQGLRVPPWFVLHVVCEVLEGLAHTHALTDHEGRPRRIIHRDVSPSNIFVSRVGETKLGDFGIAKDSARDGLTRSGQLKGKFGYMSPEQIYGELLDERSDVFAAGVVLWETLTQSRLFAGRTALESARAICEGPRTAPSTLMPDVPHALDAIVLSALEADRDRRVSSARALQSQLLDVLQVLRPTIRTPDVQQVLESLLRPRLQDFELLAMPVKLRDDQIPFREQVRADDDNEEIETAPERTAVDLHSEHDEDDGCEPLPGGGSDRSSFATSSDAHVAVTGSDPDLHAVEGPTLPMVAGLLDQAPTEDLPRLEAPAPVAIIGAQSWLEPGVDLAAEAESIARGGRSWTSRGVNLAPYAGSLPYWIKDASGDVVGPCDLYGMLGLFRQGAARRPDPSTQISVDRSSWIDIITFLKLAGYEGLLFDESFLVPARGLFAGKLEERSAITLFADLSRQAATGKLMLSPSGARPPVREIYLSKGRPVFVFAGEPSLSSAQILLDKQIVREAGIEGIMHRVARYQMPLDDIVAGSSMPSSKFRLLVMKERLVEAIRWKAGRFAFESSGEAPAADPEAPLLASWLVELVERSMPFDNLRASVARGLEGGIEAAQGLDAVLELLGATAPQRELARRISSGGGVPPDAPGLALAHVLIELRVLRRG